MTERSGAALPVMPPALLVLAGLLAAPLSGQPAPTLDLGADSIIDLPGLPRILRVRTPGSPIVALRLSVPVVEAPSEAGAGHILANLARASTIGVAGPVGLDLQATRTPWGIAYAVEGALDDFDYLAYLLRRAVGEPAPRRVEFERQRAALEADLLRDRETASGQISRELRAKAFPGSVPTGGTLEAVGTLTEASIRNLWRRTHVPDRMNLVVVGDVSDELLLSAFQDLVAPGSASEPAAPGSRASAGRPEVLRHWFGVAYTSSRPLDPVVTVAAVLMSERLRGEDVDFEAEVRLWDGRDHQIVAVIGAAYPRGAAAMRRNVRGLVAETRASLDAASVRRAVGSVRLVVLQESRTPGGRAEMIGRHVDAGSAEGLQRFLEALDAITVDQVGVLLDGFAAQSALTAEVRP